MKLSGVGRGRNSWKRKKIMLMNVIKMQFLHEKTFEALRVMLGRLTFPWTRQSLSHFLYRTQHSLTLSLIEFKEVTFCKLCKVREFDTFSTLCDFSPSSLHVTNLSSITSKYFLLQMFLLFSYTHLPLAVMEFSL